MNWLSRGAPETVLTDLAAGRRSLTHTALDELPASKPLTHLRSVLVATRALPARDEHFIQLERWTTQIIADCTDLDEKELLHRYAVWHVLRRLRARLRGDHATHNQADVARRNIGAAVAFLNWLTARNLTLSTGRQADLDEWMAEASTSQRGNTGHFVRWAKTHKLTSLDFPATRWDGPTRVTDIERRWEQARRLLHDDWATVLCMGGAAVSLGGWGVTGIVVLTSAVVVLMLFGLTVLRGAPYFPTHPGQIQVALDQLAPNSAVLDLGCGDGALLRAAAQRGHMSYGFEINPLLCLVARIRCRKYKHLVVVHWCDYWRTPIPPTVNSVYVFTAGPYAARLARRLEGEASGRTTPLQVLSYGFQLPGREPTAQIEGLYVYRLGGQ